MKMKEKEKKQTKNINEMRRKARRKNSIIVFFRTYQQAVKLHDFVVFLHIGT